MAERMIRGAQHGILPSSPVRSCSAESCGPGVLNDQTGDRFLGYGLKSAVPVARSRLISGAPSRGGSARRRCRSLAHLRVRDERDKDVFVEFLRTSRPLRQWLDDNVGPSSAHVDAPAHAA